MKILLVEDSRTLCVANERALLKAGYEVISAEDGESALQAAKKHLPDLILLDLLLPRVNGVEVLTRLKHGRGTAKIPVIILSGLSERNRQKLIDAGAEDYIEKSTIVSDKGVNRLPQVLSELFARINRKQKAAGQPFIPTGIFAAGYLVAWGGFSLLATGLQWELERLSLLSPMMVTTNYWLGGAILIAAGVWQLTPIKGMCLRHCRSPMGFLVQSWRPGRGGAFRMGLEHGSFSASAAAGS